MDFLGLKNMNISIVGYGKMGMEIERIAMNRGINVQSIIDPNAQNATHKDINERSMQGVNVCIDFTRPDAVLENIKKISHFGKNIVVGTTGWYGNLDEARNIVNNNGTGLVYAPNFSIGVNIFFRIIESAARLIDKFPDYDIFGFEMHHSKKLDSPSGTAKLIEQILVKNISRKKSVPFA